MKPNPRIFISVPDDRHLDGRRRGLKLAITRAAASYGNDLVGFEPEQFGLISRHNLREWRVDRAVELLRSCDGAIVLAFARTQVRVIEPGPPKRGRVAQPPSYLPTPYNHLEGALAIAQDLPLLILFEEGMDRTGIFNSGIKPIAIPSAADEAWVASDAFRSILDSWSTDVRRRRDVFLGYCSKANECAIQIRDALEASGFEVLDWARDFRPAGTTILEEIERAAKICRRAVFLFTRDDEVAALATATPTFDAIPRDNVLLEAGYFHRARGTKRVAILREEGTKMPVDLGGVIYLSFTRGNVSSVIPRLHSFLTDLNE